MAIEDQQPQDAATRREPSPILRQFASEWAALGTSPSTRSALRRWGRSEDALAGFTTLDQILTTLHDRTVTYSAKDAILIALVRQYQAGQQLAGRVVLQAMLPKVNQIARKNRGGIIWYDDIEDRRHEVIGHLWQCLSTHRVERNTTKVAAHLGFATLRLFSDHDVRGRSISTVFIGDDDVLMRMSQDSTASSSEKTPEDVITQELSCDSDLLEVIVWGISRGVITREEGQLLASAYCLDENHAYSDNVAEAAGLSPAAVRKRCSRARKKLTEAVRAEMMAPVPLGNLSEAAA